MLVNFYAMTRYFLTFCLLLCCYLLPAQGGAFGPRVTLVSTDLSLDSNVQAVQAGSAEFGYQFGVFARLKLGPIMLMPELLLTDSNASLTQNNTQVDLDFNKVDMPVLLGFNIFFLRLQAGPSFSFLTKAESDVAEISRYRNVDA